jgi:hypothetical protein
VQSQAAIDSDEPPETVLITGSLIRNTEAVGAPVTNFTPQDFATTGALTTADLFQSFPSANVQPGAVATNVGANIETAAPDLAFPVYQAQSWHVLTLV